MLQNEAKALDAACQAMGKPEWINDPKFNTPAARNLVKQEIYKGVEEFTITKDKYAIVDELGKKGVPCGPVLSMLEIEKDQSLYKCGTLVEIDQPIRGKVVTIGCPPKFSDFTPNVTPAPLLGEHTNEILKEIGYTDEDIDKFRTGHIVCK